MKRDVPAYVIALMVIGFLIWIVPFIRGGREKQKPGTIDRRARWGIAFEMLAFMIVFQPFFWTATAGPLWRVVAGTVFLILASVLSWSGRVALGRQWRFDAGLNSDHELVRGGPYRFVRHPIYASMLCLFLGEALLVAKWSALAVALVIFLIGTEIRVHIEDSLLASRFGGTFQTYRRSVSAYIPLIR